MQNCNNPRPFVQQKTWICFGNFLRIVTKVTSPSNKPPFGIICLVHFFLQHAKKLQIQVLRGPWKLVMIVSKLVYNLLKKLTTYLYKSEIIQLLSTSRTSKYNRLRSTVNRSLRHRMYGGHIRSTEAGLCGLWLGVTMPSVHLIDWFKQQQWMDEF